MLTLSKNRWIILLTALLLISLGISIERKELKESDLVTLELEDRGQGFLVTAIFAERR